MAIGEWFGIAVSVWTRGRLADIIASGSGGHGERPACTEQRGPTPARATPTAAAATEILKPSSAQHPCRNAAASPDPNPLPPRSPGPDPAAPVHAPQLPNSMLYFSTSLIRRHLPCCRPPPRPNQPPTNYTAAPLQQRTNAQNDNWKKCILTSFS